MEHHKTTQSVGAAGVHAGVAALRAWAAQPAHDNGSDAAAIDATELSVAQRLLLYAYAEVAATIDASLREGLEPLARQWQVDGYRPLVRGWFKARPPSTLPATPAELIDAPPAALVDELTVLVSTALRSPANEAKAKLCGLSSVLFEHPDDRRLLRALKAIPLIDRVIGKVIDIVVRRKELELMSSGIVVTERSCRSLYRLYREACEIHGLTSPPELYVEQGPLNAYTTGVERPMVVMSSLLPSLLSRDELLFVLGHELGHVRSGHVLYGAMAANLGSLVNATTFGLGNMLSGMTLEPALYAWLRRGELTADRAGLLTCQNRDAAVRALAKIGGFPPRFYRELDPAAIREQARAFQERVDESLMDRLTNLQATFGATHPWMVYRVAELDRWADSGDYQDVLTASPVERTHYADLLGDEPATAAMISRVAVALGSWWSTKNSIGAREMQVAARHLLRFGRTPRDINPIVHMVELEVARAGAEVKYTMRVLFTEGDGQPRRATLELSPDELWDDTPGHIREALIRSRDGAVALRLHGQATKGG